MDFQHLRLFRDIVHSRSISRGAAQNGITQSAASQAVQELERSLEIQLLDRSRRPLEVTEAGRLLCDFGRDVLRRRQEFETELESIRGDQGGEVRVASIYSVGISEMARLEEEFARLVPSGVINVNYLRPEKVYEAVLEERADLGLVSYPEQNREVSVIPWRNEKMVVALPPAHPLSHRRKIAPEELEGADFIAFDEDLPISRDIERYLRDHGVKVKVMHRFDNIQTMKEALRFGNNVSILPEPILRLDVEQHLLTTVPLTAPLTRPLGILLRKRRVLPRAAQSFLEILQRH